MYVCMPEHIAVNVFCHLSFGIVVHVSERGTLYPHKSRQIIQVMQKAGDWSEKSVEKSEKMVIFTEFLNSVTS